mgnify:CR=1 FL=1
MTGFLEDRHFDEISSTSNKKLCQGKNCKYSEENNIYTLTFWGIIFEIDCNLKQIRTDTPLHIQKYFTIFIIHYLRCTDIGKNTGIWISEKDFPSGVAFFRGPHRIPTHLISNRFQNDLGRFSEVCKKLGGEKLAMGDRAFGFNLAPGIRIALVYWMGDDEFPAEVKLLYDQNIKHRYALDVIFSLAVQVCYRLEKV